MRLGFLIFVPLPWILIVSANSEVDALCAFKSTLSDDPNGVLTGWDCTLVHPCTWFHITCEDYNRTTRIDLQNANLSGQLVAPLGSLPNLQYLELYNSNLSGEIPPELGNLSNLVSLDLYQNNLSGPIPDELGKLQRLRFLRLNNNSLSGTIPMSLTSINALQVLDLEFNNLSGIIPNNGSLAIFDRIVPNNDSFLSPFAGNPYLKKAPSQSSRSSSSHFREISLVAAGVGAILLLSALAVAFVQHRRRKHRVLVPAKEDSETRLGKLKRFFLRELRAATNNFHQRGKHRVQFFDLQAKEDSETHLGQLKRFPLRELRAATNNFHHKNFIGRGTFGEVYKGRMADGSLVAVKRLKDECTRGEELLFQTELQMISMVVHRNLLRLRGFCMTTTERFLVYPLMANGSVASCLRACQGLQPQLDWPKRKQIALGSARGLAYLHHQCAPKIIHLGVKAASILLNEEFEAVVGDFGLAKSMGYSDTHVTTAVCGATGYIAPEYYCSGKCSEKTDVYGYGVMLLELITGQQALDLSRLARDNAVMLDDWVKGHLEDKLARLVDANLQGNYIQEEAEQLIQVALLCIQSIPMQRPTMLQVVKMLEGDGLAERWQEWQKQEVVCRESNHALIHHNGSQIFDSTSRLRPDELSGPR